MPVIDLQGWADDLEDNRLPVIQSDIAANEQEINAQVAAISGRIDANVASISNASLLATTADALATTTHNNFVAQEVILKAYTDAGIQMLRDEFQDTLNTNTPIWQSQVLANLQASLDAALPNLDAENTAAYNDIATLKGLIESYSNSYDAALTDLLNTQLPGMMAAIADAENSVVSLANDVNTDFTALADALKSVLVVYADDAIGTNQSLTAGSREYVQYLEYNGDPPTLPVTGTFIKFVGTPQSVWPIYAADDSGNNQGFEPLGRDYVTFYESILIPELPVAGQTWVRYVGTDGNNGERGPGIWWISVTTLPANSAAAQDAWNAATEVSGGPKLRDQAWFYTGTQGNPTGQKVFTCQTVTSDTSHTWNHQEHVLRGDLLVSGTVTANEIDAKGLTIYDEAGNVVLAATGGSAGINWAKVLGDGKPEDNATAGATWETVTGRPTSLAELDAQAATQLDGKSVTYYQGTEPVGGEMGDIWFDTSTDYKMYAHDNTSWVPVQDSAAASAAAIAADQKAEGAQSTADGKITTFYSSTAPAGAGFGDLWYNTTTKQMKRFNDPDWSDVANQTTDTNQLTDGAGLGTTANWGTVTGRPSSLADLDAAAATQLDQKSVTYYQATQPTGGDTGDTWFDTNDSYKLYSFNGTNWIPVQDSAAASAAASAAQADAAAAQATADGKITTFYETSEGNIVGEEEGDLWYNSTTKVMKRYNGTMWVDVANAFNNTADLSDGAGLGQTATWSSVSGSGKPADNANYTTNTNQLTDGAGLGQTANWANVTGSGKPANNADVTAANTAAAIANQGIWATLAGKLTSGNVDTYISSAAIGEAYIGDLSAGKITTGYLTANRLNLNGTLLTSDGSGQLTLTPASGSNGISTPYVQNNAVSRGGVGSSASKTLSTSSSPWIPTASFDPDGTPVLVCAQFEYSTGGSGVFYWNITKSGGAALLSGTFANPASSGTQVITAIDTSAPTTAVQYYLAVWYSGAGTGTCSNGAILARGWLK